MVKTKARSPQRRARQPAMPSKPAAITPVEYTGLQAAYDHFNATLFEGQLLDCFITYQRKAHSAGYFAPDRFAGRIERAKQHELALNPDGFYGETDQQVCQTLVHEMVHVWQHVFGTPSKGGYHNREWAAKMKSIGLYPSNTGKPGGKETGQHMSDYIIPDGAFAVAFAKLAAKGWKLNLQSAPRQGKSGGTTKDKTTFTCPSCQQNAWGKPTLAIDCHLCNVQMIAVDRTIKKAA
ncbi:SprT-like domain-containing protein [Bradyrhizobium cenepequi]